MAKQLVAAVVVVVALLLAYVFLTEPEPEKTPGASWSLPELANFDRIEVERGEDRIVLDKGASGWRIQEPVAFSANGRQMEQVEELFADSEHPLLVDHEKQADSANLSRYGLDEEPAFRVTLFDSGEVAVAFVVGETEEAQSGATRTWIYPDGSERLYRVNRDLRRVLDKNIEEWRDKDILVLNQDQQAALQAVEIGYGSDRIRLERQENDWVMTDPVEFDFDPSLVTRYVGQIDTLRAVDFADTIGLDEAGLSDPQHTVTLFLDEGDSYSLRFGEEFTLEPEEEGSQGEQRRYVQVSDGPIFQIRESTAGQFMWTTGDFRPRQVLSLQQDEVVRIATLDADGSEMVLVRNEPPDEAHQEAEVTWRMQAPQPLDEVDMGVLRRVLSNATRVEAQRFAEGMVPEAVGFGTPRRSITITLSDDTQHVIAIGDPIEEVAEGEDPLNLDHYARVDDGDIFVLRSYKVRNLMKSADEFVPPIESSE